MNLKDFICFMFAAVNLFTFPCKHLELEASHLSPLHESFHLQATTWGWEGGDLGRGSSPKKLGHWGNDLGEVSGK
jgi:hypothetical protein